MDTFKFVEHQLFLLAIDIVAIVQGVLVGVEIDYASQFAFVIQILHYVIVIIYLTEISFRSAALLAPILISRELWGRLNGLNVLMVDLGLTVLAFIDIFVNGSGGWLWRISALRAYRLLRVRGLADSVESLHELKQVLDSVARMLRGLLAWVFLVAVVVVVAGIAVRGLFVSRGGIPRMIGAIKGGTYFGSITNSALTMLQVATRGGWAEALVRPLMASGHNVEAVVIGVFCLFSAYTVMHLAIGIVVWSTVETARSSPKSSEQIHQAETAEIMKLLTEYFEATMALAERSELSLVELKEAMAVPEINMALLTLDLPVDTVDELFHHLDKEERGEITLEILLNGIALLIKPATRFDTACLTALVGGNASYTDRLLGRATELQETMEEFHSTLAHAFDELGDLTRSSSMGQVPECILRKAGIVKNIKARTDMRYTG